MKKKQFGRLFYRCVGTFLRHADTPTLCHSERSEESKNIRFYGFFGRLRLPLNDGTRGRSGRRTCFGRSMIEMLAVLAIIGVLSIGGVWGYRKAVTKHLANNVIDDIYLSGFLIMDELFNRLPDDDVGMDMTGKFDQKSPYTFKAFAETASTFEILVQNVPYDVCQELIERELKDLDEVRANGFDKECFSDRTNEVSFFFSTDPTSDHCLQDSDCGHCSHCVKNRCQYGFKNKSENCFLCDDSRVSITNVDKDECHRCKNRMWSTLSNGRCLVRLNHDINSWSAIPKEECEKFSHQYSMSDGHNCFYCAGTFNSTTGACDTTDCHGNSKTIVGLSEDLCVQCGGNYITSFMQSGGIVGICSWP